MGAALHRSAPVDRPRPAARSAHLASPLRQDRRVLGGDRGARHRHRLRPGSGGGKLRPRHPRRIYELHPAALRALCGGGRHPRARQSLRHAARQYRHAGARRGDGELRRHDRRCDDHDPPADPRQRPAPLQRACLRVLHFPRRQYRRRAEPARRSAALRRLPARRRFLLDHRTSPRGDACRHGCCCSRFSSCSIGG